MPLVRSLILSGVIVAGVSAAGVRTPAVPASSGLDLPQLSYVTTAHQFGVVGYRDPVGAISPDGTRFAYTEGRFIRVVPIGGGAPVTLAPGEGQIRYLDVDEQLHTSSPRMSRRPGAGGCTTSGKTVVTVMGARSDRRAAATDVGARRPAAAAGLRFTSNGAELVLMLGAEIVVTSDTIAGRVSWPAVQPDGDVACIVNARITLPCGGDAAEARSRSRRVWSDRLFAGRQHRLFLVAERSRHGGVVVGRCARRGRTRRLSNFSRDAYAPSVSPRWHRRVQGADRIARILPTSRSKAARRAS